MKYLFTLVLATIMMSSVVFSQDSIDPGDSGLDSIDSLEYDLSPIVLPEWGGTAADVRGTVYHPISLSSSTPILLFLHGNHGTCYDTIQNTVGNGWPCSQNQVAINNHQGYNYFARHMASHGYMVISISSNAAIEPPINSNGRAELIKHHLQRWQEFNVTGGPAPINSKFIGKLDFSNVGLMGHSQGGEAVVHYVLQNAQEALSTPEEDRLIVNAIITLAPTNFFREVITNIPTMNISPYCAGDVPELEGVKYYDDSRYLDPSDTAPKHNLLMWGANHNYFNTIWSPEELNAFGAVDDGFSVEQCGGRLSQDQQRAAFKAYASAFFRTYLEEEEDAFLPLLRVENIEPPASAMVSSDSIFMSYHPPVAKRVDINRTDLENSDSTNTLGGSVTTSGLATVTTCGYDVDNACDNAVFTYKYPHASISVSGLPNQRLGLSQLEIGWDSSDDYFDNSISPKIKDFTNFDYIQFRVAVAVQSPLNTPGENLNFNVELRDGNGNTSFLPVDDHSKALFWPPGNITAFAFPRSMHNSVMLPLDEFDVDDSNLDLTNITNVRFLFNESQSGSIFISDLMLSTTSDLEISYCYPSIEHKQDIELKAGWNLISFNHNHHNNTLVTAVFSELISSGNLEFVSGFDNGRKIFDPFGPPFLNTLTEIKDGFGYWVKVTNDDTIFSSGTCIDEDLALQQLLEPGWHLIAYLSAIPQSPADYFADLIAEGSLEFVRGFDSGTKIFDPYEPPFLNTLKLMESGFGYWVKISDPNAKIASNSSNSDISEIDITVFPNPVKTKATILLQSKSFDNATILVYDINGREIPNVTKTTVDLNENETNSFEFNAENLSSGIYLIKVITEGETLYETIVVE